MTEMTLAELAETLGGELAGDGKTVVRGVGPIEDAREDEVTFLANARYERYAARTRAAAILVARDYAGAGQSVIRCEDPYFAFRQAMVAFYGFREAEFEGVDPRACVHATAEVGEAVRIAAFATISAGAKVARGSVIYPGVYVGPGVQIGRDCVLHANVTLYDGCVLHDRVTIHAGSSIGQDGFGYATHKGSDGIVRHEKIPQAGGVILEDDVEIGACCAIDRATMGATVIGAGTKFSNLVTIGHGTKLGRHCLVVAQAGIAGSTLVGTYCVFAGQAGVVGHIRIGDGARIGAKAGVTNDVSPGQEVLGIPAIPLSEARRAMMSFSRLPQLRTAVRRLTRKLNALRRHLGLHRDAEDEEPGRPG